MLGCNFSFSLHRHYCRCWAAPSAPWLQVLKMACLGNVRNSVSQLCLGEMHVGPCGGLTCWTCHSCHIPCHAESGWSSPDRVTDALRAKLTLASIMDDVHFCEIFIFTHFLLRSGHGILVYNMKQSDTWCFSPCHPPAIISTVSTELHKTDRASTVIFSRVSLITLSAVMSSANRTLPL